MKFMSTGFSIVTVLNSTGPPIVFTTAGRWVCRRINELVWKVRLTRSFYQSSHPLPLSSNRIKYGQVKDLILIEPRILYLAPDNLPSGEMMKKFLIIIILTLLTIPLSVSALVTYSGNHVSINESCQ